MRGKKQNKVVGALSFLTLPVCGIFALIMVIFSFDKIMGADLGFDPEVRAYYGMFIVGLLTMLSVGICFTDEKHDLVKANLIFLIVTIVLGDLLLCYQYLFVMHGLGAKWVYAIVACSVACIAGICYIMRVDKEIVESQQEKEPQNVKEERVPDGEASPKIDQLEYTKNIVTLGFEDLLFPDGASSYDDNASLTKLKNALNAFFDDQERIMDVENSVKVVMMRQVLSPSHDSSNPMRNVRIIAEKRAFCQYLMRLYDAFRFNTELNVINDVFASMMDFSSLSYMDKMTSYFLLTPRFKELPSTLYNKCLNTLFLIAYVTDSPFKSMIQKKYAECRLTPLSESALQQGAASYPRLIEVQKANYEKFLRATQK